MQYSIETQSDYIKALKIMNLCIEMSYDGEQPDGAELIDISECSHLFEIQKGTRYACVSDCEVKGVKVTGNFKSLTDIYDAIKTN